MQDLMSSHTQSLQGICECMGPYVFPLDGSHIANREGKKPDQALFQAKQARVGETATDASSLLSFSMAFSSDVPDFPLQWISPHIVKRPKIMTRFP